MNVYSLEGEIGETVKRWEGRDIVEDLGDEPTTWQSNIVIIPEKDGESITASLDMTDADHFIKRKRQGLWFKVLFTFAYE